MIIVYDHIISSNFTFHKNIHHLFIHLLPNLNPIINPPQKPSLQIPNLTLLNLYNPPIIPHQPFYLLIIINLKRYHSRNGQQP